jgi:hypothetical protein
MRFFVSQYKECKGKLGNTTLTGTDLESAEKGRLLLKLIHADKTALRLCCVGMQPWREIRCDSRETQNGFQQHHIT